MNIRTLYMRLLEARSVCDPDLEIHQSEFDALIEDIERRERRYVALFELMLKTAPELGAAINDLSGGELQQSRLKGVQRGI